MIRNKYIWQQLKRDGKANLAKQYLETMIKQGVRICNDGFPDTRSPLTTPFSIRIRIAWYREAHKEAYPHPCHVVNLTKKQETACYKQGYTDALDGMQRLGESSLGSKKVTNHIERLRKIIRGKHG